DRGEEALDLRVEPVHPAHRQADEDGQAGGGAEHEDLGGRQCKGHLTASPELSWAAGGERWHKAIRSTSTSRRSTSWPSRSASTRRRPAAPSRSPRASPRCCTSRAPPPARC